MKYKFGVQIPKHPMHRTRVGPPQRKPEMVGRTSAQNRPTTQVETFLIYEKGEIDLKNYTYIPLLMVFDVKFDGQHKCRYVANGSVTE